jgi:tetratricopeptide (TPR) repeat protein
MLQTISDYAREQLEVSGTAAEVAGRHARRYAMVGREIRDDVEGTRQVAAITRGFLEEDNLQAALDAFLEAAKGGDAEALELGLQLSGDLWMYWHIRGKNLTARDNAAAFLALSTAPSVGRAGALITAGLGSWMAGDLKRADREWAEAQAIAEELDAGRERCLVAVCRPFALMALDPEAGLESAVQSQELGRELGFPWSEALGATVRGLLEMVNGDAAAAGTSFSYALAIQQRLGEWEGGGLSLGGLAALAAQRGDTGEALDLYRQALTSFETCGDRGEEARILSEIAWTHLAAGDTELARRDFFESVRAHTDIASVRGVGLSLVGLAATEAIEGRAERATTIAAAAEVFAQDEGIAVVYAENTAARAGRGDRSRTEAVH